MGCRVVLSMLLTLRSATMRPQVYLFLLLCVTACTMPFQKLTDITLQEVVIAQAQGLQSLGGCTYPCGAALQQGTLLYFALCCADMLCCV